MSSYLTGEPVPPGFEDEMTRTAVIQKQIDSFKGGSLIGTEYVVELHEDGQVRPDYFCVLCNTCNDSRSIFTHWTSVSHRTNYLKTHYQKAFELLQQLRRSSSNSNELVLNVTTMLVKQIEQHYGRSDQILAVGGDDFRRFRAKICSQVRDKFHFDECAGPDFLDEVRQLILNTKPTESVRVTLNLGERNTEPMTIALDAISSDDDDNFAAKQASLQSAKKSRKKQEEQQPAYRAVNRSPPVGGDMAMTGAKSTTTAGIKQQLPTPKELSLQASHIAQERYKWEKFRCLLELQLKQLRDDTETYESNPEKHPDYSEEWKLFWNRRYKQLQEEKKCDPNNYDYKPEWITYWKDRRVELFNIAVNKIKKELKDKFKLGDEDEENTKELMDRYKIRVSSPKSLSGLSPAAAGAGRRKPNYRGPNNRNGHVGSDAVIDISDDEQQPPCTPSARPNRHPPYVRSMSRSPTPKRGRPLPPRMGRRSRTRSPPGPRRRQRSRSRSRSPHRRSRSPYSRGRDRSHHSRGIDDYADRGHERSNDYYRDRGDSYTRSSRSYELMETFRVMDSRLYPEYTQPGLRSLSPAGTILSGAAKEMEPVEEPEGPLTVVSVLRMLSALEDQLGSLGPKALNLLSKALAMEKVKPNAADDLLLNEDNCVFMETTKEKLKGILIAEVLDDPQKVRVVKKLISNIATIIFQVTSKGAKEAAQHEPHEHFGRKKEFQLPFDRQLVSSKLASALVISGLDDLSTEDMNKLMHFFTLLVKTNHSRRQNDRSSGLSFAEVPLRLGFDTNTNSNDGSGGGDLDIDLSELMKEVEQQLAKETGNELTSRPSTSDNGNSMESLTDSDLQTLLQNFKFLSNEEQVHLIGHLRKLEKLEPSRVERLRKYVNIAELSSDGESCSDFLTRVVAIGRPGQHDRPGAGSRMSGAGGAAATMAGLRRKSIERELSTAAKLQRRVGQHNSPNFILDDDDDDDYNFDDLVMKAKDSNGRNSNLAIMPSSMSPNPLTFKPAAPKISLKDTENIIANLMGTLTNNSNQASSAAKTQQQQQHRQQQQQQMRNVPSLMQQRQQQQHPQFGPNGDGSSGNGSYYNYGGDQMSSGPTGGYPNMQQPQQQQPQAPYNMGNYNAYGPHMGGGGGGYSGQMNPWANGPPQPYNNMPQNFMPSQQQQSQYNNMFGGHQ